MYAYSGWNASTYIVGEVRNPARAIPLSLGLGTLLVTVLYLGINAVFMRTTPVAEMVGKQEVGLIAGAYFRERRRQSDGGVYCPRIDLDGERDDVDRTARDRSNGRGSGGLVMALPAQRAGHSSPRDAGAICDREFADLRRDVPEGCELCAVQPHAFLCSHSPRRLRLALAASGTTTALSHLGLPYYSGDLPRGQRLDALAPTRRSLDARAIALGLATALLGLIVSSFAEEGASRGALIPERFGNQQPRRLLARYLASAREAPFGAERLLLS